ncbi:KpsF/GutQ family sugar-phosphate isomerase [Prosthecomicrobium sp. N25]|uniref:KpsF/GutQ family sugar-phosphate isomerase n=1 Tax=Prosthecomicrobium sp. N25 TaxID=3129254 RepID=UPI003076F4E7
MRQIDADLAGTRGAGGGSEGRQAADLAAARRTLGIEIEGLQMLAAALEGALGTAIMDTVAAVREARGRVIVTGIGKSGHICRKIAATLASTGTPAFFVHPSEASHGDLGMITPDDIVIAMSWSGESSELASILAYSRRFRVPLVAVTSNAASTLGRAADIVLEMPKVPEACPHGLAPTTSTMMQLAIGDALAISLLESRGFTAQDFRVFHPGGKLGASLKLVRDVMHQGHAVPLAPLGTLMREAILLMNQRGFGCLGVLRDDGRLAGIVTDGDLRRHIGDDLLTRKVDEVMTRRPKVIRPDALVASAMELLNSSQITALLVVENERPIGIVHMHDLLRLGVA